MTDYIVRATAADNQIRAFAATTRDVVETAREHHGTSPVATAALGRLLTAGTMMGSMMKNDTDMLTPADSRRWPFGRNYGYGRCTWRCEMGMCSIRRLCFRRRMGNWTWEGR